MKLTTKATVLTIIGLTIWWALTYGVASYVVGHVQEELAVKVARILEIIAQFLP